MNNKNIKDRLRAYLAETTPVYGLLLRGSWGCGKTFLVKTFKDEEDDELGNIWYISLFGVRSLDEDVILSRTVDKFLTRERTFKCLRQ
ncbi:MAG: P-loop NTPase fold protein [Hoylesella saccharolytica]